MWTPNRTPSRGWNSRRALKNPRTPAVPATLDISQEEYFAAAALMGLLAAQMEQPDAEWAAGLALDFGATMAKKARQRRKRKTRR